ncbi:MAG TPA: aminotransferase class V-fold PLP-dependent enzyme, partial [Pirellulales bacterium]
MADRRIYLDNAATSWPKPESVYAAVAHAMRDLGAAAGRGVSAEGTEVDRRIDAARAGIASLLGVAEPKRVIFTHNGTDSLNLAIHGLLRPGDHAIATAVDHNSVLRPLQELAATGAIELTIAACDESGVVDPQAIERALRKNTRLVAFPHASNVTGAIQPAAEIVALAHEVKAFALLDAAQTLGSIPLDARELGADLIAAPGHKGLLGPLGTGVLYLAPGVEKELRPVRQGGTGTESERDRQPDSLPEKYEAGNLNVPGLLGLGAGVAWLKQRGVAAIAAHERELTERLTARLIEIDGVQLYGPRDSANRVGIVAVNLVDCDPRELSVMLETSFRVQTRAGLHCAPRMHAALGTVNQNGTLRLSVGPF